jgi:O-antigen/teichoic acid export membrane protein
LFVDIGIYNYFIGLFLVILLSLRSTFGYWLLGEKKFSKYGAMNIVRSFTFLSMILVFLIFEGIQWEVNELILISVISEFIGLMSVIKHVPLKSIYDIRKYKPKHLSKIKLYKDYWGWGTLSDITNMLVQQIPIFTIMSIGGTPAVGQYSMALRIISAPNAVISKAIGDVYVQRASEEYIGQKKCSNSFGFALVALLITGVPIYLGLYYFSPELIHIALGESWVDAGKIAQPLSVLMLGAFIASTLSRTLQVIKKQKIDFFWQLTLILSIVFVWIYSTYMEHTVLEFLWGYVFIYMSLYVALLIISGLLSKKK